MASVEHTEEERLPEDNGSLYSLEREALANLVALVIAHTRATAADMIAPTPATAAELDARDAQLNHLLARWGIDDIQEFNVQVGKRLDDMEPVHKVSDDQSSGWRPPWTSPSDAAAWFILVCGGLVLLWPHIPL